MESSDTTLPSQRESNSTKTFARLSAEECQRDLYDQIRQAFHDSKHEEVKVLCLFLDSGDEMFLDDLSLGELWGWRGWAWSARLVNNQIREREIASHCLSRGIKILDKLARRSFASPEIIEDINCRLHEQKDLLSSIQGTFKTLQSQDQVSSYDSSQSQQFFRSYQSFVDVLTRAAGHHPASEPAPTPQQYNQESDEDLQTPVERSPASTSTGPYPWDSLPEPKPATPSPDRTISAASSRSPTPSPAVNEVPILQCFTYKPWPVYSNGYPEDPFNDMGLVERQPYRHEFTFPKSTVPVQPGARDIVINRIALLRRFAQKVDMEKERGQIFHATTDLLDNWHPVLDAGLRAEVLRFRALAFHSLKTVENNVKAIRNIREACENLEKLKPQPGQSWKFPVFDGYMTFENAMELFQDTCEDILKYRRFPFSNELAQERLTHEQWEADRRYTSYNDPVEPTMREFLARDHGRPRNECGL